MNVWKMVMFQPKKHRKVRCLFGAIIADWMLETLRVDDNIQLGGGFNKYF